MSTVRDRLRAATAEAHTALEGALALGDRLRTADDVTRVLARFHGFFATLEPALDRQLGAAVMAGRHRLPTLEADLRAAGWTAAAIAALPACADAGDLADGSEAWGALYVVEGARLGGRIIARDLAERGVAHALQFWPADGGRAPPWGQFLAGLETVLDATRAEHGACMTFRRLHLWMTADEQHGG